MKSATAKLPKGQGYPLKPSVLEAALAGSTIDIDTHLIRSPGDLFDAHFWPPNHNVPYERLYVRAGSVLANEVSDERRRVESVVIPALVTWISHILAQDRKSPIRGEQQFLNLAKL